jgi:short-chain Z-isoprenyl diphosphate synthase
MTRSPSRWQSVMAGARRLPGEVRLSGFMLWQSVHSELYFCDVNWPAMRRIDYLRAIRSFQRRERRFGV